MRVIVMFGGGGALGAFDCGVWNALAPLLQQHGASLAAVGGASIGAINAACLARHGSDLAAGADALDALWRCEMVTPSVPFAGLWADRERSAWNGVLTGLLLGNRRLYHANPLQWNAAAGLNRVQQPLMDRRAMWHWLESRIGAVHTGPMDDALLCVPAVDVVSGELVLFDSAQAPVTAEHLCASSAIPLLFEPVTIDGRLYWDADMTRESMLPLMLDRVRSRGRLSVQGDTAQPTVLVLVEHMSRETARAPRSGVEMAQRALELMLHGKTDVPAECLEGIDHVIRIARAPMPHDAVSGQFDYSPERIGELVEQGQQQAQQAWRGHWQQVGRGMPGPVRHAPRAQAQAAPRN